MTRLIFRYQVIIATAFIVFTLLGCNDVSNTKDESSVDTQAPELYLPEPETNDVFVSDLDDPYNTYRIPSIIKTSAGTLLAFIEGRMDSDADRNENDIMLRRSYDDGASWEPMQLVTEQGVHSLNDPTPVQILDGANAGRILLMFRRIPCKMEYIGSPCEPVGDLPYGMLMTYSDDDGETWAQAEDITSQMRDDHDGPGPGIAIIKQLAPAAGRIIFPIHNRNNQIYSFYSDDHGETWQYGEESPYGETESGANEVQFVELSDGRLMLNARDLEGSGYRKISISTDAGETWAGLKDDDELTDIQVMASIINFSDTNNSDRNRLLFSNPVGPDIRVHGTIRLSYDDGETWPVSKLLIEDFNDELGFAYSQLVRLDCRNVGILWERGINQFISFTRFSIEWLTDGEDIPVCK
jgi:sialidase-1